MTERSFLDSNIPLYAADASAGPKRKKALALIDAGLRTRRGVLSTQVLQEYYVNATKKLGLTADTARSSVELLGSMHVTVILPEDVLAAIDIHRLHSVSFWDSLIIRAAQKSGCKILYSEDMQDGQHFGSVKIVNPFASA
jgi:predicted nucleic acid-binding protein